MLCAMLGRRRPGGGSRARGFELGFWGEYIRRRVRSLSQGETGHQNNPRFYGFHFGGGGESRIKTGSATQRDRRIFDGKIGAVRLDDLHRIHAGKERKKIKALDKQRLKAPTISKKRTSLQRQ